MVAGVGLRVNAACMIILKPLALFYLIVIGRYIGIIHTYFSVILPMPASLIDGQGGRCTCTFNLSNTIDDPFSPPLQPPFIPSLQYVYDHIQ